MSDFIEKTKISTLVYSPYWLSVTPLLQVLTYLFSEEISKYWMPEEFDRETFKLEDGGTVGIDWACDKDTKIGRPQRTSTKSKPILMMLPGLGGASDNIYTTALVQ